jgi:putative lipase involved disintegration of autophagic bodies
LISYVDHPSLGNQASVETMSYVSTQASTIDPGAHMSMNLMDPDVSDKETIMTLAKMSANSYYSPNSSDWESLAHFQWVPRLFRCLGAFAFEFVACFAGGGG